MQPASSMGKWRDKKMGGGAGFCKADLGESRLERGEMASFSPDCYIQHISNSAQ